MNRSSKSWNVRPSRFPFGVSVEVLGVVDGVDRRDAQQKAEDLYGRSVVVELVHAGQNSPERNRVSRQNGSDGIQRPLPGLHHVQSPLRDMTADEAQMARAAASCPGLSKSREKSSIRMLHARSLTANRTITELEAARLRAVVLELSAQLPDHIVMLAGGAS